MKSPHHNVYVIELDKSVLADKKFMSDNPHNTNQTPLYVGMTGLPVEQRFENHMKGYKSSRYAHRYGIKLLPNLYQHLNPMSFDGAVKMEKRLANELRKQGYPVWQK